MHCALSIQYFSSKSKTSSSVTTATKNKQNERISINSTSDQIKQINEIDLQQDSIQMSTVQGQSGLVSIVTNIPLKLITFLKKQGLMRSLEHLLVLVIAIKILSSLKIQSRGKIGLRNYLIKSIIRLGKKNRFVKGKLDEYLEKESIKVVTKSLEGKKIMSKYGVLPEQGMPAQKILAILDERINADIDPTAGKTFAYVYEQSKQHSKLVEQCFMKYVHSNALNPIMFNSSRVIESQVIRMTSTLFHGDDKCVGNITSCGTESLMLAMKTYRDYRGNGDVIMCTTGHPAINKGCHYVGLNVVQIPYDHTKRMSVPHLQQVISSSTVLVVCSAPSYPNGVIDDVQAIAKVCLEYGVPLHVDSAIGGFILPFIQMERPGKIKPWDFRVEGVLSINADVHKYGYAPKGSSTLIFKRSDIRRKQMFAFSTWPGGLFIAPTVIGSKNVGTFSSAWGSLLGLGVKGFRETTKKILTTVDKLVEFIKETPELQLQGQPDSSIVTFSCKNFCCYKLADAMQKRGFHLQKQANPETIHLSVMPNHFAIVDELIRLMIESIEEIKADPSLYESGSKAIYGMMAQIPDESITEEFLAFFMDEIYKFRT